MYQDPIYEKALREVREENFANLRDEVKSVENVIERFLTQILECTSTISERDFNMCGI